MREARIGRLNGRFVVSWWVDGKRRRYRLEADSLRDAEREALDVIAREAGTTKPETIADVWSAYRAEKEGRRVADAMKHEAKAVLGHFGHLRPDQVTTATCRAYTAARRAQGKGDGTIWTELGHLRSALKWAEAHRLIDRAPPVERPAKPKPKDRWLTKAEAVRLVQAADGHIRLAILLMLGTACRVGAALDLTWNRVDLERRQIVLGLPDATTRKGRATVPINADLMAALTVAKRAALSEYVIEWSGGPVASIKTGFNSAVERAGLEGVTPHVLRHTAAVWMVADGAPMAKVSQYLGHTSTSVTERVYGRFAPDHLRDVAASLEFMPAASQVR
jgi:integrase